MMIVKSFRGTFSMAFLVLVGLTCCLVHAETKISPAHVNINHRDFGEVLEAWALMNSEASYDPEFALRRNTDYFSLNEFDKRSNRAQYIDQIENRIVLDAFLINEVDYFVWNVRLRLDEYDFERNAFPIVEARSGSFGLRRGRISSDGFQVPAHSWFRSAPFGQYHSTRARYQFNWQPTSVDYGFPDAQSGQAFLERFSRRPNARLLMRLKGIEMRDEVRFFHFDIACMLLYSQDDQAVHFGQIVPSTGDAAACDEHRQLIGERGIEGAVIGIRDMFE